MTKLIIWLPQGRLGNLIFQCQAIHSIFDSDYTVLTFKTNFNDVFESPKNFHFLKIPFLHKGRIIIKINSFIRLLAKKRICGLVTPRECLLNGQMLAETLEVERTRGLLPIWIFDGWFQSDQFCVTKLKIKTHLGKVFEEKFGGIPTESRVAIHMRFGDYSSWNIFGKVGAVLPDDYYKNAVNKMKTDVIDPVFIVFSDDLTKARGVLKNIDAKFFYHDGAEGEDLVGISKCGNAIVAASTFSWWGAYLIDNPTRIIIAPNYWLGFKSKTWYPLDIKTNAFDYIDAL
jgi:Glycosyl transferase family 11